MKTQNKVRMQIITAVTFLLFIGSAKMLAQHQMGGNMNSN